jgi:MFS family permease
MLFVGCAALLFAIAGARRPSVFAVFVTLAVLSAGGAFFRPANNGLLPSLVPKDHFSNAASWQSSTWQIAVITGPTVGALIYQAGASPRPVYLTAAGGLGLAAVLVAGIRTRTVGLNREPPTLTAALAGIRYVWSRKVLLGCTVLDFFAVFLGGAVALFPVFATDVLHVGTTALGAMRSAQAVGASAMAGFLAFRPIRRRAGKKLLACVAVFGLATIVFGLSKSFWVSLAAIAALGAADMVSVVVRMTLEQAATPPEMRGRVSAVNMVFVGGSNELGDLESGVAAQLLGPVAAVVLGGVGTLVVVALSWWVFRDIRKIDRLEDVTPAT